MYGIFVLFVIFVDICQEMLRLILPLCVILSLWFSCTIALRKGILGLDEINFDKVVDGSRNVLVEIVEYSWKATNVRHLFCFCTDAILCYEF
jgi:hypothetical protein